MALVTSSCGNIQLCAGLCSGIEANLHAVRAIWPQSAGWTEDPGITEVEEEVEEEVDNIDLQVTDTLRCVCTEGLI